MQWNITKVFIDGLAALGWVTERKTVKPEVIKRQMAKYGDVRYAANGHSHSH